MSRSVPIDRTDLTSRLTDPTSPSHASLDFAQRCQRWAELIAVGATQLPAELQPTELQAVLAEVARLRRRRLIHLVARAIAEDLHRDSEHRNRSLQHAEERI